MRRSEEEMMRLQKEARVARQQAEKALEVAQAAERDMLEMQKRSKKDRDYLLVAVLRILRELRSCADGAGVPEARRLAASFSGGPVHIREGNYGDIRQKIFDLLLDFDLVTEDGEFKYWGDV